MTLKENLDTEITKTSQTKVICDGHGAMGHPRIYLDISKLGRATCPYCNHIFVLENKHN